MDVGHIHVGFHEGPVSQGNIFPFTIELFQRSQHELGYVWTLLPAGTPKDTKNVSLQPLRL